MLTAATKNDMRVIRNTVGCNKWIHSGNTGHRATWHTPESGDIASKGQGGKGGGSGLHIGGLRWRSRRGKVRLEERLRDIAALPAQMEAVQISTSLLAFNVEVGKGRLLACGGDVECEVGVGGRRREARAG